MFSANYARLTGAAAASVVACGLLLIVGCQSSPDAEEHPPPSEPVEEPAEADEPYADPQQEPPPQAEQPGDPMAQPPGETAEIDDEQLEKFADVFVATAHLEDEIEERMREVQTQEEAQQVEAEILAEIEQEVHAAGLTLDEYGQIVEQLQHDPELERQLRQILEDRDKTHLLPQPGI